MSSSGEGTPTGIRIDERWRAVSVNFRYRKEKETPPKAARGGGGEVGGRRWKRNPTRNTKRDAGLSPPPLHLGVLPLLRPSPRILSKPYPPSSFLSLFSIPPSVSRAFAVAKHCSCVHVLLFSFLRCIYGRLASKGDQYRTKERGQTGKVNQCRPTHLWFFVICATARPIFRKLGSGRWSDPGHVSQDTTLISPFLYRGGGIKIGSFAPLGRRAFSLTWSCFLDPAA